MSELLTALHAALKDLTIVDKGRKAAAGSFSYQYADLGDVIRATRPALAAHGLIALTPVHEHPAGLAVTVSVYHVSGEALTFEPLPFPAGKDAQSTGSAITYYRRYALLAALGMATGDDDDGAQAEPDLSPAARKRLGHRVHQLDPLMRAALREWLDEQGLPDRAALMTQAQCAAVNDWLDKATDGASCDGPAYITEVPQTLVKAYCPECGWSGPVRDASHREDAAKVRRDVNVHNEERHDEW